MYLFYSFSSLFLLASITTLNSLSPTPYLPSPSPSIEWDHLPSITFFLIRSLFFSFFSSPPHFTTSFFIPPHFSYFHLSRSLFLLFSLCSYSQSICSLLNAVLTAIFKPSSDIFITRSSHSLESKLK